MSEVNVRLEQMMPIIRERLASGESFRFVPNGTSMLPMLLGGRDHVVLSPIDGPLKKYDIPLYQRSNGQYVLHRAVKVGQTYTCIGDNQFTYEPGVTQQQLIGKVTGFTRKGKDYRVTDLSYRIYCVLWHRSRWPRRIWAGICRRVGNLVKCK